MALATSRVTRWVSGIRANSHLTRSGIRGSNFGATQIGVRW
jgi:hypothetical protein